MIMSIASCGVLTCLLLDDGRGGSALVEDLEHEQLCRFRLAHVPKEPVRMHRRLVEDIARSKNLRRIGVDLALDRALQDVREDRAGMLMGPDAIPSSAPPSRRERKDGHAPFRIGDVAQRSLSQYF